MASGQPNDESAIFNSARRIEMLNERDAFLAEACGGDADLRVRVEQLLADATETQGDTSIPAPGLEATMLTTVSDDDVDAPNAGDSLAPDDETAVTVGSKTPSVLRSLESQIDKVPSVTLWTTDDEADVPVARPASPEIPNQPAESRYRLDGEIARGGMGAVFRGRDTDLGRDLAIKVLLDSHKRSPEVVQRFIEEAQIGGQLQHPGIAPVYELGEFADHRPFFSMKLVRGQTLAKLLSDRNEPSEDRSRFLSIFEQICQTMAYAHSRGVIHRDLKPSNIMVGAFGEVQVMDWGLAKVLGSGGVADERKSLEQHTDKSSIHTVRDGVGSDVGGVVGSVGSNTQVGRVMGTPAYMPPEQALGETDNLDERADVFGLGAILCEILTGRPPYVAEDGMRVLRLASRGKLERCIQELDECGADSELIMLTKHCLEKDAQDRPRHAGVLAERITEYLESVQAKLRNAELAKVDAEARAEELGRRRKLMYLIGGLLAVGLLCSAFAAKYFYASEQRQRSLAQEKSRLATENERLANERTLERNDAVRARRTAEQERQLAVDAKAAESKQRGVAERRLTYVQSNVDLLASVFEDLDADQVEAEGAELRVVLGKRLVNAAVNLPDFEEDPLSRGRLADAFARALVSLGYVKEAVPLHEQTLAARKQELGNGHADTLSSMNNLATAYERAGRLAESIELHEQALATSKSMHGDDHADTLTSMNQLAVAYASAGRLAEAIPLYEQTLPAMKSKLGDDHAFVFVVMGNLATAYASAGRVDEAIKLHEQALAASILKLGDDHPRTLTTMNNLALAYVAANRLDEAVPLHEKTLTAQKLKLGENHPGTLTSMNNLALAYVAAGRLEEAIALHEQTLAARKLKLGDDHGDTLSSMKNLAAAYQRAGRLMDALPLLEKAFRMNHGRSGTVAGTAPPTNLQRASKLAGDCLAALAKEDYVAAERCARECVTIREKELPDSWLTFNAQTLLGAALLGQQKYDQAEPLLLTGYEGMTARRSQIPQQALNRLSDACGWMAEVYDATGRTDEADRWRDEAAGPRKIQAEAEESPPAADGS